MRIATKQQLYMQNNNKLLIGSMVLLGVLALALIFCPTIASSYAESVTDELTTETSVNVGSTISVGLQSNVDIDISPVADVVHDKKAAKLTVTTNNSSGYSLYMETLDATADLTSSDLSNTQKIIPIERATTLDQFATNTWGYNLGPAGSVNKDRIYYPVPVDNTVVMETGGTSYKDEYDLTFGVAVGADLPVGRYSNRIIISAVANPTVITSLAQAEYMQSMNLELCQNTDYGVTKQLTDLRDGKKYWVARLLDGNCWMTQNLALTLKDFGDGEGLRAMTENGDVGSKLTSDNTDFTGVWDETSPYPPVETYQLANQGTAVATNTESWDLGKYVLATPLLASTACTNTTTTLADCTKVGFVDVSNGDKFTPNYRAVIGKWDGANAAENTLITVDCSEWEGTGTNKVCVAGSYDTHYLAGNYYQYNAVTAGSGASVIANGDMATSSICPKGWKLPLAGTKNNTASGSFYYLLEKYGLTSKASSDLLAPVGSPMEKYNVASEPLYYVRSGVVSPYYPSLLNVGSIGFVWSGVSSSNTYAYHLNLGASAVKPSLSQYDRWHGLSVRCAIY